MADHRSQVEAAFPEVGHLDDADLRERVLRAWTLGLERGGWQHVDDIPYAWNIGEVSTVDHVRGVTRLAEAMIDIQTGFHGASVDRDVALAACLLHDVGKCYEYVAYVDDELVDPDPRYADPTIPHSLSSYALAHEVGCPIAVQRAIPHVIGEVPRRTLEAELVKAANDASSNAITQATMGITLAEWIDRYSTATGAADDE